MRKAMPVLFLLLLSAAPLFAAVTETLTVEREGKLILVNASMVIDAPRPVVFQALSDYERFPELSDSYLESHYLEPAPDGTLRIYTKVEGCIWFFCRTIERYARLELEPDRMITATVEPDLSDANYAREQWVLEDEGAATRVLYTHELEPNFWVPPGIGLWAIRKVLGSKSLRAATRIESLALEKQAEAEAAMMIQDSE